MTKIWRGEGCANTFVSHCISKEDRTVIRTLMEDLTPPFQTRQRIGRMRDNVGLNDDVDNAINPAINHRAETI